MVQRYNFEKEISYVNKIKLTEIAKTVQVL